MSKAKRIKLNGRTISQNQIDALEDLANGAQICRDRSSFVLRRFGVSPHSCYLFWPKNHQGVAQKLQSKNTHMTCQTLIDSGLVESEGYTKNGVGSSSTYYKLSPMGRKLLKEYEDSGLSRRA
jgi:hypothetical protein